jgi:hypothetical protein
MRAKLRRDNEEPKEKQSRTDSAKREPNLANPRTETDAPKRAKDRKAIEAPRWANPSTDTDDAIRE